TEERSKCMSRIKSKWTSHETRMHNLHKGHKIKHKMYPKIEGSLDIIIKDQNTAVFLQGCFWHKCPRCYKEPKSRREYWIPKIQRNVQRDRISTKILKNKGFSVAPIREHDIKKDIDNSLRELLLK
ncbi:MAG: hypothetical protein Q8Q42_02590, partial [Nanoarchaeota archaeon]|nr:hypothetical protein [Nanoarchaeota archaeon]